MDKRKNRALIITVSVLLALAVILAPFVTVITMVVALPPQYDDLYHGILDEKVELLRSIEEEKIVVIGGSSVAFGIDSDLLSEYTGMPVVNFGVYAALGTKIMLDLSRPEINEGDIVVLALELDPETLSLYFNSETALQAIDGDYSLFWGLDMDNKLSTLGGMWSFLGDKWTRHKNGTPATVSGIYSSRYFDKDTGDFDYPRPELAGVMLPNGCLTDEKELIELRTEELTREGDGYDFPAFAKYLNKYIDDLERRGATVLFSWCPMNSLAVNSEEDEAARRSSIDEYVEYLKDSIDCTFIGNIYDHIMSPLYFFDTNLHLNDAGARMNTMLLADEMRAVIDDFAYVIDRNAFPEPPMLAHEHRDRDDDGTCDVLLCAIDFEDGCDNHGDENGDSICDDCGEPIYPECQKHVDADGDGICDSLGCGISLNDELLATYFELELREGLVEDYYEIVGLTAAGLEQSVLQAPRFVDGIPVSTIAEGAFDGATKLRRFDIPNDSNISQLVGNVFRGAPSLTDLWIHKMPDYIAPPASLNGASASLRIHIPPDSGYSAHYNWSQLKAADGTSFRNYVNDALIEE